jgi:hypothetical protein
VGSMWKYQLSPSEYLPCIGDIADSPCVRRMLEESQFSFLMNTKGGALCFSYKERRLALREKRT